MGKVLASMKIIFRVMVVFFCCFLACHNAYAADYVGTEQCVTCHQSQFDLWQDSHHAMAMRHASEESVKGDFNNVQRDFRGSTNRFYKKQDEYWVRIIGPDKKLHDYQIRYTFGVYPLQQYMVEFPDGRVQLIPYAWDARDASEGGQRWFDLYPDQTETYQEFFWTNTGQNWNYMCADCHSTNVEKNYNRQKNAYATSFSEINVACEACHGPGSDHISIYASGQKQPGGLSGFQKTLTRPVTRWVETPGSATLGPELIGHSEQTLVCAQCHSRRLQISDTNPATESRFGDRHLLNLIDGRRYYPDGQIFDEVYVYGSFLQSKMHKNGVVCSNCHDSHSAKLILPEDQICLQCHQANSYDVNDHHHHEDGSAGAQCVNCHMPETSYMQIDNRRDHAWHIPNPLLAKTLGVPDTCLQCHKDKDSDWSLSITNQWRSASPEKETHAFANAFYAADRGQSVSAELSLIAQNSDNSAIIRASALQRLNGFADPNTLIALARGVKSPDAMVRLGAVSGAASLGLNERWRIVSPLLGDRVLAVRSQAARVLMPLWQSLNDEQREAVAPALEDYNNIQRFNADRGFAHTNRGDILVYQGRLEEAQEAYQQSIRIEPYFVNAYVNLADLYRLQNDESKVISVLQAGESVVPDSATLNYSMALSYIRQKQLDKAIAHLEKATGFEPDEPQYHLVYGMALESSQPSVAMSAVRRAYTLSDNPQHLYALCEMQIRYKAFQARQCLAELAKEVPVNIVDALRQQLDAGQ